MTGSTGAAPADADVVDVELAVGRLASVVLHATTLAERMLALPDAGSEGDRAVRLERLQDAAARGRAALLRVVEEPSRQA